jgi:hypothetical protein
MGEVIASRSAEVHAEVSASRSDEVEARRAARLAEAEAEVAFRVWFTEKFNQDDNYGRIVYPLNEGWHAGVRWALERGGEGAES